MTAPQGRVPAARQTLIEPLSASAFAAFGSVLGSPCPTDPAALAFSHPGSDFWHAHDFDPGEGGRTEVLWVNYRDHSLRLRTLEVHWLTEQAIIPLGGHDIVHVVCPTLDDGSRMPDTARLRAFRVASGQGICMRPGCWHTSFVFGGQTACLMLTRRSTTRDLVAHLRGEAAAVETRIVPVVQPGEAAWLLLA